MSKKWGTYLTSQVANAESKSGPDTRTNSTLTQVVIGTDYLFYANGSTELFPDISLTVPFQRVSVDKNEALNNEGALELSARLVGRTHWGSLEPFAFGGFTYRDEGRSALIPYGVGSEFHLHSMNLGAELRGYQTVVNDEFSNSPDRRQVVAIKNGNSLKFYSVDQSILETNFWLRSNSHGDFGWKIGGGMTLTGAASAGGWSLFLGLSWGLEGSAAMPEKPSTLHPRPAQPKEEIDRFEEEISDEPNQIYFEKSAPHPKSAPNPPPKPVQKKSPKQQIQKNLDPTEFQIELKRKKKKKTSSEPISPPH